MKKLSLLFFAGMLFFAGSAMAQEQSESLVGTPCIGEPSTGGTGKFGSDCVKHCGEGYYYDRAGAKLDGKERVCTKYPKAGGYNCTKGWKFKYLVNDTQYTCQEAVMTDKRIR